MLRLARVAAHDSRRVRASGVIEEAGREWRLELETEFEGTRGERHLAASSCEALSNAAALTLALILNPDAREEAPLPPQTLSPPATAEVPTPVASPIRPLRLRWLGAARATANIGTLKNPWPGVELGLGASLGGPWLLLVGSYRLPADAHVSGGSGAGGRVWAASAGLLGCWDFGARASVGPCAGFEVTRIQGQGISVVNPKHGQTTYGAASLGLRTGLHVSRRFRIRIGGFAIIPTRRPSLYLDGIGTVLQPPALGAKLEAGADFELP